MEKDYIDQTIYLTSQNKIFKLFFFLVVITLGGLAPIIPSRLGHDPQTPIVLTEDLRDHLSTRSSHQQ